MSRYLFLICKRLAIFMLIIALAWFTVFYFFPFLDNRLPLIFTLLITYGFIAYIALPTLIRIWQAMQRPTHVPTRTIAADGWAVDPINIAIAAKSQQDLILAMHKAGWLLADDKTFKNMLKEIYAIIFNKSYLNAPFGNYYVFGRKQDLGFQIPIGKSPRHRHHVRFWRIAQTKQEEEHAHLGFWRRLLRKFLTKKQDIWIGSAILDRGINLRWRNLQLDHGVQSDTTLEREFLVNSLKDAGVINDCHGIKTGDALRTRHQGFGEKIIADGYIKLCELKRQSN